LSSVIIGFSSLLFLGKIAREPYVADKEHVGLAEASHGLVEASHVFGKIV
jgi:hypothetical protein